MFNESFIPWSLGPQFFFEDAMLLADCETFVFRPYDEDG